VGGIGGGGGGGGGEGGGRNVTEYPSPEDLVITREDRGGRSKVAFEFDRVFAPGSTQGEVFEAVAPIVTSVLDGYSVRRWGREGGREGGLCMWGLCIYVRLTNNASSPSLPPSLFST